MITQPTNENERASSFPTLPTISYTYPFPIQLVSRLPIPFTQILCPQNPYSNYYPRHRGNPTQLPHPNSQRTDLLIWIDPLVLNQNKLAVAPIFPYYYPYLNRNGRPIKFGLSHLRYLYRTLALINLGKDAGEASHYQLR